ncbi:hypothetical protein ACFYV7_39375 [Nocardia suismassiliense]|uniref:Uncharacterized protein n=1 Tax=Nocardia suismassiliense TaxID=2077092 RepID=A0ABW6R749_9NOCA
MLEVFTGAAAVFGGLTWGLRHDGLVRLMAGFVAVAHSDPGRRADALEVLRCTGHHRASTRNGTTRKRQLPSSASGERRS